jgi:RNA polymerase sigma-70 factor (ECF subfamily)
MGVRVAALAAYVEDRVEELQCGEVERRDERFEEMIGRQSRFMFRVAFSLLRNRHDAEDAVQEAFLKLYRSEAWLRMQNEKGFLARTVWRVALDYLPRAQERTLDISEMQLATSDGPGGAWLSPEQSALDQDERTVLRRLIDALPEDLRQPLVLSSIEEMTSREVAEAMGIPEGTVRTRVMRARAELKRRFVAMKGQR